LILNEPLLWEKGARGRSGFLLPRRDVDRAEKDDVVKGAAVRQTLVGLWYVGIV
jgi:hypothetical protein